MKIFGVAITPFLLAPVFTLLAQENPTKSPQVQDLHFLIGTWEITFDLYSAKHPDKGVVSNEKGTLVCEYDLNTNDVPMFITCKGEVTNEKGRTRTFQESIRYSRFVDSFERIGLFSHWPGTGNETIYYDSLKRTFQINGTLNYPRGRLERFHDAYQFNDDYTSYKREHLTNLSDMPVSEFNLALKGTGKKIK